MRIFGKILTAVFLLFFHYTAQTTADTVSLKLRADNRQMVLFSDFQFTHAGYLSFVISSVSVTATTSSQPDPSSIGFFLVNQPLSEFNQSTICMLDFKYVTRLFTFQDLSHHHPFNKSYPVTHPGDNSLLFVNCKGDSLVTINGHVDMDDDGKTKNFLSAGKRLLYLIASLIYLCFLAVWISVCFKNRRCCHKMHLIMGGLLVMIFLQFIFAAAALESLFYVFRLIRNVHLFTVIVLIGAGWCFWRPFLPPLDKLVLIIVIILQVWANYKEGWVDLTLGYRVLDIICCVVVFVPMARSCDLLRDDENAAMSFANLSLFGYAVTLYIYLPITRLILITPWVDCVLGETGLLAFCMFVFDIFRPFDEDKDQSSVEIAGDEESRV